MSYTPKRNDDPTGKEMPNKASKPKREVNPDAKEDLTKSSKTTDVGGGHDIVVLKEDGSNIDEWLEDCRIVASVLGGDTYAQVFINGKMGKLDLPDQPATNSSKAEVEIYKLELADYVKRNGINKSHKGRVFWTIFKSLGRHNRRLLKEETEYKQGPDSAIESQDLPLLVKLVKKVHNTDGSGDLEGRHTILSDEWYNNMSQKKHELVMELEDRFEDHIKARIDCGMDLPNKADIIRNFERSLNHKFEEAKRIRAIAMRTDPRNNKPFPDLHACAKFYKAHEDSTDKVKSRHRSQEYLAGYHAAEFKAGSGNNSDSSEGRCKKGRGSRGDKPNSKPRSDQQVKMSTPGASPETTA